MKTEEISELGVGHLSRHRQIVVPPAIAGRLEAARRLREEAEERLRVARATAWRSKRGPPERRFVDAAALVVPADGEIRFFRRKRFVLGDRARRRWRESAGGIADEAAGGFAERRSLGVGGWGAVMSKRKWRRITHR
jgi:hypothetical protein